MTVLEDRTKMAERGDDERSLDKMFEWLEKMPVPEGIKTEIVGGHIFMSPQRDTHWDIIFNVLDQLRTKYPRERIKSDVRIDYPGFLNGFATDVTLLRAGATKNKKGQWRYEDVEFVVEVISRTTAANDYTPKKNAYATANVPVYLIVDPYQGRCFLYTEPKNGAYENDRKFVFGDTIDLTHTVVGISLATAEFPRD